MGLTDSELYSRKRCLHVLKLLILYLEKNRRSVMVELDPKVAVFHFIPQDFSVWSDVIILFETLEEKQVHIIKPVLSKFSRITQLTCNKDLDANGSPAVHTSWVLCLMRRMLSHESKYLVRWILSVILNMDYRACPLHEQNSKLFLNIVVQAFSNQSLYTRMQEQDNSLFLSAEKISTFFKNYISCIESEAEQAEIVQYLLFAISSHSWCGVALFHVFSALATLPSLPAWNGTDLSHVRTILTSSQRTQEAVFHDSLCHYIVECCILFMDWESLGFKDFVEFIIIFRNEEHSFLTADGWNKIVSKLGEVFCKTSQTAFVSDATAFCIENIKKFKVLEDAGKQYNMETFEIRKFAVTLSVLAEISSKTPRESEETAFFSWSSLLEPLISSFLFVSKRPYMPIEKFLNVLQLITFLLREARTSNRIPMGKSITSCFLHSFETIEFIFNRLMCSVKEPHQFYETVAFRDALFELSHVEEFQAYFVKLSQSFVLKFRDACRDCNSSLPLLISFWKILNFTIGDNSVMEFHKFLCEINVHFLSTILNEDLLNKCLKTVAFESEAFKNEWLKIANDSVSDFWSITNHIFSHFPAGELDNVTLALVEQATEVLTQGPIAAVVPTIKTLKFILPKLGRNSLLQLEELCGACWRACLELRGNESFRPAFQGFVEIIFQPQMLETPFFNLLHHYIECFENLAEKSPGTFYVVIRQFCAAFTLEYLMMSSFDSVPILTYALTYGPIHHKGQKIIESTLIYMAEQYNKFDIDAYNDRNKPYFFVRVIAILYLLKNVSLKSEQNEEFAINLINNLIDEDSKIMSIQSSRFANSYCHRKRNRIWQILILLQNNILTLNSNKKMLSTILKLLDAENQQPSIRCLQEWMIIKIIHLHEKLLPTFVSSFENCSEKRPGFITSMISIMIHVILHLKSICEDVCLRCYPIVISFGMAQNFNIRLYARLALMKLHAFCEKENMTCALSKYDYISKLIESQSSSESGNFSKNILKLEQDFYFSVFHPIKHFSLETIFFQLPRLTHVTFEELIKPIFVKSLPNCGVPCYNADSSLRDSSPTSWSNKLTDEMCENDSFDFNFQKKISPSKDCLYPTNEISEKIKEVGGLIVIASLVDRIPNLGGLCRTCEVFSVNELVIGCLKYTEDKQFQNLAVSADKWVKMREVRPYHLKDYLLSLKGRGYTLVGAEQTDNSCKLTSYQFPKNTALLLGHEKEGLPVELIQVLDACVEIPQTGVIRSLNVHVSGAILIWEYARQHSSNIS